MTKRQYDVLLAILIAAAGLVVLALIYIYIWPGNGISSGGGGSTTPPTANDGSWESIQASGRMVVGTSLDYPPFNFRNENFQPDGFDTALIQEIGNRLGVTIELRDMAFDGLGDALVIGQIDAAIAALSVTPERQAVVDFSNVYFVSEDSVLARADSPITRVTTAQDVAGQRVGVQRGTVFQTWAQDNLVDTGIIPASNLFVYEQATDGLRDLREQRVDLVLLDKQAADADVAAGGVKEVGGQLNLQRMAIAMPKGSSALQEQINRALLELQNEGRVTQLAQQYLNVEPGQIIPPPTPTPVPPGPTPIPPPTVTPPSCVNGMQFVADLNLNDQNMTAPPPVTPGQPFSKGWRIVNTGTCTWDSSYRLTFISGNVPEAQMGGQPVPIQGLVVTGQQYDIYVDLVAPLRPGVYQGVWQMVDAQNRPFGDRIWVGVTVPAPATPTPFPTQTPSPQIDFRADRTTIQQGQCVTFSWSVQGASAVYFYSQGEAWQNGAVPPQGNRLVCPPQTSSYFLRVVFANGLVETRQITIVVNPAPGAPVITLFVANPARITFGQCVSVQWQVQGSTSRVTISGNGQTLWDNAPLNGNLQDCPAVVGTVQYSLVAQGPGGTSQAQAYVTVSDAAIATPVPTRPPDVPIINSFSVNPPQIGVNQCATINWATSGATWLVRLLRNNVLVLDNAGLVGSAQDCVPLPGTFVYELVASTAGGQMTAADQSLLVIDNVPSNPLANTSWTLQALNNAALIPGSSATASFGGANEINGFLGCNSFNGRYIVNSNQMSITGLTQSNQLCESPLGIMGQESAYVQAMTLATTYELSGDGRTLVIRGPGGQELLRYSRN